MWKPLPPGRVLKTMRLTIIHNSPNEQCLLAMGLGYCNRYQTQTPDSVPVRTLGTQEGWIMRFHIYWGRKRNIPYKDVEISPYQTYFKIVRLTTIRNRLKQTISVSDRLKLLHYGLKIIKLDRNIPLTMLVHIYFPGRNCSKMSVQRD